MSNDPKPAMPDISARAVAGFMALVTVAFVALGAGGYAWLGMSPLAPLRFDWTDTALGVAIGIALAGPVLWLAPRIGPLRQLLDLIGEGVARFRPGYGAILVFSLAAGIGEEYFFRGFLETWIGPVEILLFGLAHVGVPWSSRLVFCLFLFTLMMGAVFWIVTHLLGLIPAMAAHAAYDAAILIYLRRRLG